MNQKPPQRIGRYRLIRRIGRGGSGEVYLARLEAAGDVRRLAAVKILFHTADDRRHHEALLAEARLGALLCHPNIAQVLDAGVENGLSWFAMEFVSGLSFCDVLDSGAGQIPPWIAARIVADACAAVHALHETTDEQEKALNVVHRDVTPHNLLVSWDGNVKLVDLGVAHSALRTSVTTSGVIKGKLGYMSPEQASGAPVDRRCDVFALGVQLWEALAGRRLFKRPTESETLASIVRGDVPPLRDQPNVPLVLCEIVAGALAIDRAARTSTALELQRALEAALSGAGVVIGPCEIARFLAHIAPERVREHIGWLREPEDGSSAAEPDERATAQARSKGATLSRRRRRSRGVTFGAAVGLMVAATVIIMLQPGADRSPRARNETIVPPTTSHEAAAKPVAAPTMPPERPAAVTVTPEKREAPKPRVASATRRRALAPAGAGILYVSASPIWATISLDGKSTGTTPTVFSDVPAGPHFLDALPLGKGPPVRRRVIVEAGTTARVGFEFDPQ